MTETEQHILDALLDLEQAVARMKTDSPKPTADEVSRPKSTNLLPIFARIEELGRALPPSADPQLLHYLRKKSYEKARLWLQGRDAENAAGNCHGHVE